MSRVEQIDADWIADAHAGHRDTITLTRYEEITARCDRCHVMFWSGPLYDTEEVARNYTIHRHEGCA